MATEMRWADNRVLDNVERCACCDRPVKPGAPMVTVINGGDDVATSADEIDENDAGFMGCFSVGPDCLRKYLPNAYI